MNVNIYHRIITLSLLACLAVPLSIGLSHALEHDEHNICLSQNENHIHAEEFDCSNMHFFISSNDIPKEMFFDSVFVGTNEKNLDFPEDSYTSFPFNFSKERAPPVFS